MRDVVPEKNLRLRADDKVWAAITEGLDRLEVKYGSDEREGFAREWVLGSGGSGKTFLAQMYARFHWLKPRKQTTEPQARDRRADITALLAGNGLERESGVWAEE